MELKYVIPWESPELPFWFDPFDFLIRWSFGPLILWSFDPLVLWSFDPSIVWTWKMWYHGRSPESPFWFFASLPPFSSSKGKPSAGILPKLFSFREKLSAGLRSQKLSVEQNISYEAILPYLTILYRNCSTWKSISYQNVKLLVMLSNFIMSSHEKNAPHL